MLIFSRKPLCFKRVDISIAYCPELAVDICYKRSILLSLLELSDTMRSRWAELSEPIECHRVFRREYLL
jgi:hypothetical protein